MSNPTTNLDHWALYPAGLSGLQSNDFTLELGEEHDDCYDVTFVVPVELEWQTAKLIMHLISNQPVKADAPLRISKDEDSVRVTTIYPSYLGDPNGKRAY
ncbi:hypothetical protein [Streptomyces sp. Tu10]|uniref:hypothetical protein n=1 Tax=Streptomyces sp. Tu10 TaxID=2838018 RepID=UPI001BDD1A4C|nr:hypothetical protein [Streptomyces sp. Tu10]MBT1103093.1 hypothetical protein [Streptomyces sp. Tu10]